MSAAPRVAGLTPLTSIDFPGRLAAVVFLQGCPWRCGYCHNPGLLPADTSAPLLPWQDVLAFLRRRQGLLDGVVFSGGEPTLQASLPAALDEVRALGYETGLHSAGIYPDKLRHLLPRLDWLGLDIKAPWSDYDTVTGVRGSGQSAERALEAALQAQVALECRTTWQESLFPVERLTALGEDLARRGVKRWALQACRTGGRSTPWPTGLEAALRALFPELVLRG